MNTFISALAFASLLILAGCGTKSGGDGSVTLAVKVTGAASVLAEKHSFSAQTEARSFTPTSFKLPLLKISIAKKDGTEEKTIYKCEKSTGAECLVDLQSQTALDAIAAKAASVTVAKGTYDKVMLATCVEGTSGSDTTVAKITGSATGPNSSTWTTHATNVVTTDGTGTAQELDVGNWGCSTKSVIVGGGITVGDTALTLTVVVGNYMAGVFNSATSSGMGGCKVAGGATSGNGLCVTYPALMAYVGTGTPTTKRFSIAHDSSANPSAATKANALLIVSFDPAGTPLMAYGRTYFTSTSDTVASNTKTSSLAAGGYTLQYGRPTYVTETNFETFVATGKLVAFTQGGSSDTFAAKYAAFDTSGTHTGTVTSQDGVDTWYYLATLIP